VTVLNEADAIMLGDQAVSAVYAGANKVWPATPPPLGPYAEAILADNPVAWFRLNDGSANAVDQMGGPNGSYGSGIARTQPSLLPSGEVGSASFAAGNTGIAISDSPAIRLLPGYSIELWMLPTATTMNVLMPQIYGFAMTWQMNTILTYILGAVVSRTMSVSLSTTTPNHFVIVVADRVGTNSTLSLYVNGAVGNSAAQWIGTTDVTPENGIVLGGPGQTYPTAYTGAAQEFALYNYALTPQQIANHYAAAQP